MDSIVKKYSKKYFAIFSNLNKREKNNDINNQNKRKRRFLLFRLLVFINFIFGCCKSVANRENMKNHGKNLKRIY